MGFNASWFAKVAFCLLLALATALAGILYLGAKFLGPADEASELRSLQAIADQTTAAETAVPPRAGVKAQKDPAPDDNAEKAKRANRKDLVSAEQQELQLGRQERRRLRAERRRALEDANASVRGRANKPRRETPRDAPFFPFRF